MKPRALIAGIALAALAAGATAQDSRQTQRQLDQVRRELRDVASERRRIEGERGEASRELRRLDEQVGSSGRALAETESRLRAQQAQLAQLQSRRDELTANLDTRREELRRLLRAAYTVGEDAPLKLLLAQDRSAEGRRLLAYHGYVQRQRAARIAVLREELASIDTLEQDIVRTRAQLDREHGQQRARVAQLEQDRQRRSELVARLDSRYADRQARERALGSDARSLEQVLAQLRAAARRAEAQRRAEAERAARAARQDAARPGTRPAASAARGAAASASTPATVAATGPRVGGLGWPAAGQLLAGFGATMPDGRRSSGLLIGAAAGAPVNAVADGRVVFSEWMNGYGLIVIVDHGGGTLSLYAHNDALLREAGAQVKRGDRVASVGTSGGQGRPALYFELRRNGQPVNPQGWLQQQR